MVILMDTEVKTVKTKKARDNRKTICKICENSRALIRKYNLYLCRRCFKDNAEKLGFRKYE